MNTGERASKLALLKETNKILYMPTDAEKIQIEARTKEIKSDFMHVLRIALKAKNVAEGTKTGS